MAVCPVYLVARREGGVARGKLMIIQAHRQGDPGLTRKYRQVITSCLLCGSCTQSCPNEVDTAAVVQAARAELAGKKKLGWFKRFVLRRILPSRRLLPALLRGARWSRALWAAKIPRDSGLYIRFSGRKNRRRIPPIAKKFFMAGDVLSTPRTLRAPRTPAGAGMKVAVFVGCVSNYLRPQAADATVRVLSSLGAEVWVPEDQGCCGLPAFGAGEVEAARKLARRNLEAFLPAGGPVPDAITTPCASCAAMLKKHLPELLEDPRARELADRVVPFSRLAVRLGGNAAAGESTRGPLLCYHDPCHLSRGFGEKDAPRQLLTTLPGAGFVEMDHPCKCCGHGGSFNVSHYDLSTAISRQKVESILASGADMLVTECSGCLLQLAEALGRQRPGFDVITTPEALFRFKFDKPESPP
jgi:glycolate oxidase iron-sulfur subunit